MKLRTTESKELECLPYWQRAKYLHFCVPSYCYPYKLLKLFFRINSKFVPMNKFFSNWTILCRAVKRNSRLRRSNVLGKTRFLSEEIFVGCWKSRLFWSLSMFEIKFWNIGIVTMETFSERNKSCRTSIIFLGSKFFSWKLWFLTYSVISMALWYWNLENPPHWLNLSVLNVHSNKFIISVWYA